MKQREDPNKPIYQHKNRTEFLLVTSVTFIFFFVEALLHYNIGKNGEVGFHFPTNGELTRIVVIVAIFSILSASTVAMINRALGIHRTS